MKVAWVSVYDAVNLAAYDGRGYYHPRSLQDQNINVSYIGSLQIPTFYKPFLKLKSKLYGNRYLPSKTYSHLFEPFVLKSYSRQISQRLSQLNDIDIVFSGVCQYLQPITYLDCKQPIVIWTDAPLTATLNFYPGNNENEVAQEYLRNGIPSDRKAFHKASLSIFASEWAAQNAISHYQLNRAKVKVVPFGSNIPSNFSFDDIQEIVNSRPSDQCKLLFIGWDWDRKGGDIAVQVASELNRSGLRTQLTVVGCKPHIDKSQQSYIRCLGYISNASLEGIKELQKLLAESHFFILPTKAETFGHVFCEANAFGVPSLATDVGGIPTIIKDNVNGIKFSTNAKAEEYCTYISNLFYNYSQYKELALSSFKEYESRLNWSVAGRTVKELLMGITKN